MKIYGKLAISIIVLLTLLTLSLAPVYASGAGSVSTAIESTWKEAAGQAEKADNCKNYCEYRVYCENP